MAIDKAIDSTRLNDALKATADKIRSKTGGTNDIQFNMDTGFADAVEAIQVGGGGEDSMWRSILDRTITALDTDKITSLGTSALRDSTKLETVNLPNLASVLGGNTFNGCTVLRSVRVPSLTTLGDFMFVGCSALNDFDFTNVINLGRQTFYSTALVEVVAPNATSMGTTLFSACNSLKKVDFGKTIGISASCFNSCTILDTIILRSNELNTLTVSNAFTGTPFAPGGSGGTVYVPAALIEQYQTATNWSTMYAAGTCNFVAIEGSEYE
jgi:hypothetical protein